jgi:hypothetical protein
LGGQITRATGQPQRHEAGRNGAGGDKNDLSAATPPFGDHVDEPAKAAVIERATCRGQRARADLDDKSLSVPQVSMTGGGHPQSLLKLGQSP